MAKCVFGQHFLCRARYRAMLSPVLPSVRHMDGSVMFCALHDQLASLRRHAQLMRCFSAVAELLVLILLRNRNTYVLCHSY